jgi:Uma2 family endonuclease
MYGRADLAIDPPPDLVLEVEYSKPKVDKAKIYAAIGVSEFWRYNGSVLRIYILNGGEYQETQTSHTFIGIAVKEIPQFIQQAKQNGEMATTRAFRVWVREQIAKLEL